MAYANAESSILPAEHLELFRGLPFYEPDSAFVVYATVKKIKKAKWFFMKTTTDRLPEYRPYAEIKFELEGKNHRLICYQSRQLMNNPDYEDYLFLPFTDLSSGEGSYGGGRYLDLRLGEIKKGRVVLDFNYAYNPYCAYNHKYSCPIPPAENHLNVAIKAGAAAYNYPAD